MIFQYHYRVLTHETSWKAKGGVNETLEFHFLLPVHMGKKICQNTSKCLEFRTYK